MLGQFIGAIVLTALFAVVAQAQIIGDSPASGVGAAVSASSGRVRNVIRSHGPEGSASDSLEERQYRATVNRIPDRKASSDPWNSVRAKPEVSPVADRHRLQ